ncbi:MAG: hypothetical protein LCH54_04555 [Bacteroidetes bacterium]|nr:hypothetical protein [Bacteroidota bacterium]
MKIKFILTLCLPVLFFTGLSCNSPTEPKDNPGSDTTSHNFVWDIDTIGYRSSFINGGVIINENDIWVAGEIYPDVPSYNNKITHGVAHWDGKKWVAEIVRAKIFPDNDDIKAPVSISDITYTLSGNLFISTGLVLLKKESDQWKQIASDKWDHFGFGKIFGNDESNLYIYGVQGGLSHFDGNVLTQIPTTTNLDIVDMHGDYNPNTREYELLALASTDMSHMDGTKLFKVNPTGVIELNVTGLDNFSKRSIWFSGGGPYLIAGDGVYSKGVLSDPNWKQKTDFPANNWYSAEIGGWSKNDFFLLQIDGHVLHYNGSTWKDLKQDLNLNQIDISRVIVRDDLVLMMGSEVNSMPRAIIIRGKRIK